ncbi:MAG: hypothetical protein H6506_03260 [Calditrichaeota bacterium]|nr:hypothetical protein [Calditrichota bacterium]MCB9366275.1 hypothetical protein [Calditrichota bacterium]MCB9391655.1 hypothetical protein [Calditrichota bacterium]
MKRLLISLAIAFVLLIPGCDIPGSGTIRIGISTTPGSAVLYLAEASGLFQKYHVDAKIVELQDRYELNDAFVRGDLDAVCISHDQFQAFESLPSLEAGVFMLIGVKNRNSSFGETGDFNGSCLSHEEDVLVGRRGEVMKRRSEWRRLLLAYEHARLLYIGRHSLELKLLVDWKQQSIESMLAEFDQWTVFGALQQDSLLGEGGPYVEHIGRWQGNLNVSSSLAADAEKLMERNGSEIGRHLSR